MSPFGYHVFCLKLKIIKKFTVRAWNTLFIVVNAGSKTAPKKISNVEVVRDSGSQLPTEKRGIEQENWQVWNWNSKQTQSESSDRNRNERERGAMQADEPWDCPQRTLLARPPISSSLSLPWLSPPSSFTRSHSFHLFYI